GGRQRADRGAPLVGRRRRLAHPPRLRGPGDLLFVTLGANQLLQLVLELVGLVQLLGLRERLAVVQFARAVWAARVGVDLGARLRQRAAFATLVGLRRGEVVEAVGPRHGSSQPRR